MSKNLIITTDENFQKEVLESPVPVLVDFWAAWCGSCRVVAPVVEELANEYIGKFKFAKLNIDENTETASFYGIRSIPTLAVFHRGELVDAVIGAVPKNVLKARLDEQLSKVDVN